jgi:hypothetical protein
LEWGSELLPELAAAVEAEEEAKEKARKDEEEKEKKAKKDLEEKEKKAEEKKTIDGWFEEFMAGDITKEELDRRVAELTGEGTAKTGAEKDKGKGKEMRPRPRPAFKGAESSKSAAVMVTDDDHDDKDGDQRDDEDEDEDELPVAIGTKRKAATQWVVSGVNDPKVRC